MLYLAPGLAARSTLRMFPDCADHAYQTQGNSTAAGYDYHTVFLGKGVRVGNDHPVASIKTSTCGPRHTLFDGPNDVTFCDGKC